MFSLLGPSRVRSSVVTERTEMDGNVIIKIPNGTSSVAGGGEENGNKLSVRRMVRLLRQSPGGRVGPGEEEDGDPSDDPRPTRYSAGY